MRSLKPPSRPPGRRRATFAAQVRPLIPAAVAPSDAAPLADGVAAAGTSALYARGDHVHPASGGGGAWSPIDLWTVAYWPLSELAPNIGSLDVKGARALAYSSSGSITFDATGPGGVGRAFSGAAFLNATWSNPTDMQIGGTGEWTIEGWAKLPAGLANGAGIIKMYYDGSHWPWRLYAQPDGTLVTGWMDGTETDIPQTSGSKLTLDAWSHFAVVKKLPAGVSGTATVDFWVDGALQCTASGVDNTYGHNTQSVHLCVAADEPWGGTAWRWPGSLAKLRYSRKARSDSEITDFFNNSPTLG